MWDTKLQKHKKILQVHKKYTSIKYSVIWSQKNIAQED